MILDYVRQIKEHGTDKLSSVHANNLGGRCAVEILVRTDEQDVTVIDVAEELSQEQAFELGTQISEQYKIPFSF